MITPIPPYRVSIMITILLFVCVNAIAKDSSRKITSSSAKRKLVYNKPVGDDSESIRHDGITRGKTDKNAPDLYALAPDHVGTTTYENPTLYWYQSATTDAKIEVGINRNDQIDPILQVVFTKRKGPGIHKIELSKHNLKIEKDIEYEWFVTILEDAKDHSRDIVASGALKRIDPPKSVASNLLSNNIEDLIYTFAEEGIWYDALEFASQLIEQHPDNPEYRELRADLLDQGDLIEVADFDRKSAAKSK